MGTLKKIGPYDFVSAFGNTCATAIYLEQFCMRTTSGPFDWVGHPNKPTLGPFLQVMKSGFGHFLEESELVPLEDPGMFNDPAHDYYRNRVTDIWFAHDFVRGVPLHEAFPEVKAKYDRRIRRFEARMRTGERILLIYHFKGKAQPDEELVSAIGEIRELYGNPRIELLAISVDPSVADPDIREVAHGVYAVAGDIYGKGGDIVLGRIKVCKRIYSRIRLRHHWKYILQYHVNSVKRRIKRLFNGRRK